MTSGRVVSVNVGRARSVGDGDDAVRTAIFKEPVAGRVRARGHNLDGDEQADRENHGGYDQAVYAYAREDAAHWESRLGRTIEPGGFGENLTTQGIDLCDARVGERWRVGTAVLEVSGPRIPCRKLATRMGRPIFLKEFRAAVRPGAYLRIAQAGELGAGDEIELLERPDHDVTIALIFRAYLHDRALAAGMLDAPALPEQWRTWATDAAAAA
jgi:MOSC domain-containing protein YiiM